ncbi:S8 family serine peptidase [Ferrimonas sp. YFM]|uniref:S8 family peptidase n=1 Tax=Ferrimonas sp. YFM TaxID=3028878 RepID=UPI0025735D8A|nr:S8 family serine peptidase [Ferrimonas sp. YFM]BDY05997.1 hypothetical protein F0521_30380 [Ferrimonas sp. YFM]
MRGFTALVVLLTLLFTVTAIASEHDTFRPGQAAALVSVQRLLCTVESQSEQSWLERWRAFKPRVLARYDQRSVILLSPEDAREREAIERTLRHADSLLAMEWDRVPARDRRHATWAVDGAHPNRNRNAADVEPLVITPGRWQSAQRLGLAHPEFRGQGEGAVTAVIDNRFDLSHPALSDVSIKFRQHIGFESPGPAPVRRHGDDVVSLIWAKAPGNQPPMQGVAPRAELVALSVHQPWTSNLLHALFLAEQQGADVINLSWLLAEVSPVLSDYLHYLAQRANHDKGIALVAAAHPDPIANIGLAAHPDVIVISATDHSGKLANVSWDKAVSLSAPSYLPIINYQGNDLKTFSKTSASTAIAAGVITLIRRARPQLTVRQLKAGLHRYERCRARQQVLLDAVNILAWLDSSPECSSGRQVHATRQ